MKKSTLPVAGMVGYPVVIVIYLVIFLLWAGPLAAQQLLSQAKLILPIGHTGEISTIKFSPDGKRVVTASMDSTVKIWDAVTGQLEANLKGHGHFVAEARFSGDGKKIISFSVDSIGNTIIWDAGTGKLLVSLYGNEQSLEYKPDGQTTVVAWVDSAGVVRDVDTRKLLVTLKGWSSAYWAKTASPDGKELLAYARHRPLALWDLGTGQFIHMVSVDSGKILEARFGSGEKWGLLTDSVDWRKATIRDLGAVDPQKPIDPQKSVDPQNTDVNRSTITLQGNTDTIASSVFSPDGHRLVTLFETSDPEQIYVDSPLLVMDTLPLAKGVKTISNEARLWDAVSGKLVATLHGHGAMIRKVVFSADGKKILTVSGDSTAKIWNAETGQLVATLRGHAGKITDGCFSPDGMRVAIGSEDRTASLWNAGNGKKVASLRGHAVEAWSVRYSPDGGKALIFYEDSSIRIWDMTTGKVVLSLKGPFASAVAFSPDGKTMVTTPARRFTVELRDVSTGKVLRKLMPVFDPFSAEFSADGKKIFLRSYYSGKIWEPATGRSVSVSLDTYTEEGDPFSPDGKKILLITRRGVTIADAGTGHYLGGLSGCPDAVKAACFTPDGKKVIVASFNDDVGVWDALTGMPLVPVLGSRIHRPAIFFSTDGKTMFARPRYGGATSAWDLTTHKLISRTEDPEGRVAATALSADRKQVAIAVDGSVMIRDSYTGRGLAELKGHAAPVEALRFSPDGKKVLTCSADNTSKLWDAATGNLLFTFFAIDSSDYLTIDPEGRYDGTEGARKLLYYTCGTEIVGLEQLKGLSWEPNLAAKILGTIHEAITAKSTSANQLCDYTPLVEEKDLADTAAMGKAGEAPKPGAGGYDYLYTVKARDGGIGEIQVFVNNKMIQTLRPDRVFRSGEVYQFVVHHEDIAPYFSREGDNQVVVKATTRDGNLSSRGVPGSAGGYTDQPETAAANPDMYILSIGVSKYKGENMQLHFAGKDAADFCHAASGAARKLLNTDGRDHVHAWSCETEEGSLLWPAKNEIKKIFDTIVREAKPDDILVLFFAGHGSVRSGETNYYLLTSEAESFDQLNSIPGEVAISTDELDSLMRSVKANKQILILDACGSGQALKNLEGLVVRKREIPADQQRALEKLKDKTGTFILSASAADQAAYETNLFDQGLLTYSLLSRLKLGDGLRSGKYVDVSKWFNVSSDGVKELAADIKGRQDPQILGEASFDIGLVDREVATGIHLSTRRKIFGRSLLLGNGDLTDELGLSALVDKQLDNFSAGARGGSVAYMPDNTQPDSAYSIRGRYSIRDGQIWVNGVLYMGQKQKLYTFPEKFPLKDKEGLAKAIVDKINLYLTRKDGPGTRVPMRPGKGK